MKSPLRGKTIIVWHATWDRIHRVVHELRVHRSRDGRARDARDERAVDSRSVDSQAGTRRRSIAFVRVSAGTAPMRAAFESATGGTRRGSRVKYAIVSDIHGNIESLERALALVGDEDTVLCLGDIVGYGPNPNECVTTVRERAETRCSVITILRRSRTSASSISTMRPSGDRVDANGAERREPWLAQPALVRVALPGFLLSARRAGIISNTFSTNVRRRRHLPQPMRRSCLSVTRTSPSIGYKSPTEASGTNTCKTAANCTSKRVSGISSTSAASGSRAISILRRRS